MYTYNPSCFKTFFLTISFLLSIYTVKKVEKIALSRQMKDKYWREVGINHGLLCNGGIFETKVVKFKIEDQIE